MVEMTEREAAALSLLQELAKQDVHDCECSAWNGKPCNCFACDVWNILRMGDKDDLSADA